MQFFADDKSLFLKVHNIDKSVTELNVDLKKISQEPINEKCNLTLISRNNQMKFFFSRKSDSENVFYPPTKFNNNNKYSLYNNNS